MLVQYAACAPKSSVMGVWWWDDSLDKSYVDYAYDYGVNEIYYCDSGFDSDTADFIQYAKRKEMDVYLLSGEWQWIYDKTNLVNLIERYISYNNTSVYKYKGIHLDIEPHQSTEWKDSASLSQQEKEIKRVEIVTRLVTLVKEINSMYPNIDIHYDIPFWLDQMVTIDGVTKEAYKYIIDYSSRVYIMSYRDTAEKIFSVSEDEINYAKAKGKTIVLGVETYSEEGDQVSFMEEGKSYMYTEIDVLKSMIPDNVGICIHHIKTWYDMAD